MPQNKFMSSYANNSVQSNIYNFNSHIESNYYQPLSSCTNNLDIIQANQRPFILHKQFTPPQTPNNLRYASLSPFSRLDNLQFKRGPNNILIKKYSTPIIMPSLTSRRDGLNTPSVSFKNFNEFQYCNIQGSQSSPYNSHAVPGASGSRETHFAFKQSNVILSDNKIEKNSTEKTSTVIPTNYNLSKKISKGGKSSISINTPNLRSNNGNVNHGVARGENAPKSAQHSSFLKNVEQSDTKYNNNGTNSGCPSETFSQLTSNNEIIEVKKDLIERVPDASNGVLQRLKPNEYIKMDDLVLEPATQRGSFGVVFKGRIRSGVWSNKEVAVKRWKFDNESRITEEHFKSLEREVYAYRLLRHPNICSYIGVCLEPGFYAIITEYLANGNLFELLYENKVLVSASDRLKISRQLCDAVNFIHRNNMIHRDIKTANIILDHSNNVKLCDFGQTRTMNILTKTSSFGVILDENGGSPRYMAPECFYIGKSIDEKSDVWAIACCLLEIFGGPIPFFECSSNEEVINAVVVERKKPKIPSWFHPSISNLLSRCFERKPLNRPSSYEILMILNGLNSEDIRKYGMNVKRNINGDLEPGNNVNCTNGNIGNGRRIVGNCIGVAQQKRIVVRAPTSAD
ncbi:protein kinase domain-containing protein [Cryptosporidium ubiquitum]|uniref:Protein kinase domain-containing protein n=1 Tax=Cryptosporidium ubiquitum TaxID=857276 RepID=A0A1J4MKT7_9CRYT|nr:protein kinase domain-containing protein [Cryptosporidium ubiquitum]OII74882.1 protein kinase domain-containing protein [Cryptosporidium ubiquitum]